MYASLTTVRGAGPEVSATAGWPPSRCSSGCGSSIAAGLKTKVTGVERYEVVMIDTETLDRPG